MCSSQSSTEWTASNLQVPELGRLLSFSPLCPPSLPTHPVIPEGLHSCSCPITQTRIVCAALGTGTPVSGLVRWGWGHCTWADVEGPLHGRAAGVPGQLRGRALGSLRDVPEGHATRCGWPSSTTGEILFGCKLTTHLLPSFTWVPNKSDWSHPRAGMPARSTHCAAGDAASSAGLNGVLAWVTICNSLIFI